MNRKNPFIAAFLNFMFFGAGTVYNGRRTWVGLLMILGGNVVQAVEIKVSPAVDHLIPTIWPFLLGGLVIVKLASAIDAYQEARAISGDASVRALA